MTRPSIVRADTIDLQDHHSPSAQDHSKSPRLGGNANSLGPHQAETIREVTHDIADEQRRSPRVSLDNRNSLDEIDSFADELVANSTSGNTRAQGARDKNSNMNQEDALAIAQNGGVSSSDEGELDGDDDLDDDMMDKISSSPSIEDEDIDFEFVYALHTFVATVEGQANATKGDTMVLLDDSNSYWWLVRVVKDSSIGYLPAEHIETPTERLARLNKHRNVDLSATMLGDTAEKKQQTFKSPIRFGRKTVTFTSPTYHDYTEIDDYSSDEEDLDDLFAGSTTTTKQDQQQEQKKDTRDPASTISIIEDDSSEESARVEPLKPRSNKEVKMAMEPSKVDTVEEEDETRSSEEILFDNRQEGPSRSRNGTVRNTDSFFRDETVETKKITLTPNLLRDDNQPRPSQDSTTKDIKSRGSLDKMDKELMSDKEKKKHQDKSRKEKEKKPSAIRSFFSRKDRKKSVDDDDESFGKRSMDIVSEPRDSESIEEVASPDRQPQRSTSKLQKQMPRTEASPGKGGETSSTMELAAYLAESRVNDVSNVPPASMRIVNPETQETHEVPSNSQIGGDPAKVRSSSAAAQHDDTKALARALGRSASTGGEPRATKTVKPRPLMDLDELSSSDEDDVSHPTNRTTPEQPAEKKPEGGLRPQLPGAFPDSFDAAAKPNASTAAGQGQKDRLSESPVQVSPVNATRPPALEIDTSSQEGRSSSDVPSPELMPGDETPKDSSSTKSAKEPGWDDEKLRAFFDDGEHVRDLLMVVYDKTDVEPVGKDHPVVSGMFREQNAKLAEITTQLDNMLGDWLARKQRLRGSHLRPETNKSTPTQPLRSTHVHVCLPHLIIFNLSSSPPSSSFGTGAFSFARLTLDSTR
ncbi:Tip elongation aberrant protein Tea4 [Fusarium oxysporum f. sp. raphani]|uniref:Tip elongation aberrant protein Tea4 n=1 Tax=Fusarium oxysporum f. sp. raphani TaxID=96318 RepID=A0A8J5PYS7_FUSOX|nr:Tip elongation aberrant protein Tea4 [Fusarium oxysporum f. sp. raphani]